MVEVSGAPARSTAVSKRTVPLLAVQLEGAQAQPAVDPLDQAGQLGAPRRRHDQRAVAGAGDDTAAVGLQEAHVLAVAAGDGDDEAGLAGEAGRAHVQLVEAGGERLDQIRVRRRGGLVHVASLVLDWCSAAGMVAAAAAGLARYVPCPRTSMCAGHWTPTRTA
jgi:hypothetical protein